MIVDVRTCALLARKMARRLELFKTHALPVMRRHGLERAGYCVSHIGPLSQVVHLWRYDSLARHGEEARGARRRPRLENSHRRNGSAAGLHPTSFSPRHQR